MTSATSTLPNDDAVLGQIRRVLHGRTVRILDLGGGSGVYAVPLAGDGHEVLVLDHSNDALATLGRRAHAEGVDDRVTGRTADLDSLGASLQAASGDLVLCHRVLEHVESAEATLAAAAEALAPDGLLSIVVTNRPGAVLSRIIAGRLDEAEALLESAAPVPSGRRFDAAELTELVQRSGLRVVAMRGVGLIGELNPAEAATAAGRALAERVADDAVLSGAAPLLHVLAAHRHGS